MFRVALSARAEKGLGKAPKERLQRICAAIDPPERSYFPDDHDVRQLKGTDHGYRIRVGFWRIIYKVEFDQRTITIVGILPRKKAYR